MRRGQGGADACKGVRSCNCMQLSNSRRRRIITPTLQCHPTTAIQHSKALAVVLYVHVQERLIRPCCLDPASLNCRSGEERATGMKQLAAERRHHEDQVSCGH